MVLACALVLTVLMVAVMITDFSRFIIPNKLVLTLLALYPLMLVIIHGRSDWYFDILIGAGMLGLGFALFAFRIMGGGDIKLLVVCSLFVGKQAFLPFIMGVALWGGALAIVLLMARELAPFICLKLGKPADAIPRVFTPKQPVPYGIAIAISFLVLLWTGQMSGMVL